MINIQGRLLRIASMVEGYERIADIGTDHAYIPIWLAQTKKCHKIIATDIKVGPLQKAVKNVNKHHVSDKVELRLGNGITSIREGECDAFIIAGMGGVLIADILEESFETVKRAGAIIMQPVYTDEVLREYLHQKGFCIETEALVRDEGRIYVVIKAYYDGVQRKDKLLYYHIGRSLFENEDPLLEAYLERRIRIQTKIVQGMEKSQQQDKSIIQREFELLVQMKVAYESLFGSLHP